MIKEKEWIWRGLPGHFICAKDCIFRLCTDIGDYRISTVGAMYRNDKLEEIGHESHYETFVFKLEDGEIEDYNEVDSDYVCCGKVERSNEKFDELARENHMKMCYKYAKLEG